MIYLLEGNEFRPELNCTGATKGMYANFNISDLILERLELASKTNELIHTQWLRNIGKTHMLIKFAKKNGYLVAHPNAYALRDKEEYNYKHIYRDYEFGYSLKKDIDIRNVVIDEGLKSYEIQQIKDKGFNIITGFYTPKKEDESSFNEKVLKTLTDEIESLTPKLQKTRDGEDYGTYKNLINAYREVLNLIRYFPSDDQAISGNK